MQNYTFLASAAFGLEGIVAKELNRLGIAAKAEIGAARFTCSLLDAYRANLCLRTADRVLMVLDEVPVTTFEALFQAVRNIPWEKYLTRDANIHVTGKCIRSQLMSVRDCQAITKKAIIERLRMVWRMDRFTETGAQYPIEVAIMKDVARITLNLSGDALNRRGYRTWNGEAPMRETLAAAILDCSPWRKNLPLYDPCCGTGTILIEGAIKAMGQAAGLYRSFACDSFSFMPQDEMKKLRSTYSETQNEPSFTIQGSDIDQSALTLCKKHIEQAGFAGDIQVHQEDLRTLTLPMENGVFVVNPPYGERLSDQKEARALYGELGKLLKRHPTWQMAVITSDYAFERYFGRRATQKRRLYNGRLECELFIYRK